MCGCFILKFSGKIIILCFYAELENNTLTLKFRILLVIILEV